MSCKGNYITARAGLADEAAPATLESVQAQTSEILARQKADATSRRWATIFAVAGALFAAIKLGVIAIPHLRRRAHAHAGSLAVSNPRRRRR